jgi:hypothetical protein
MEACDAKTTTAPQAHTAAPTNIEALASRLAGRVHDDGSR